MRTRIVGTGSSLPKKIVTNTYLETIMDTSDEWIRSRTGIGERRIAIEETTTSMSVEASLKALDNANVSPEEIDLIIAATVSADMLVLSTACQIQSELGAVNATAFDINAACAGFVFALNTANAYIQNGLYKNALIVGVETLSKLSDWNDRSTCVLFGDGGAAAVVKKDEVGVLQSIQGSDGAKGNVLTCTSRPVNNIFVKNSTELGYIYMDGREVFQFAVKKVPLIIEEILEKEGLSVEDIDWFILHQANIRIIQSIMKRLNIPEEKVPTNVERCGNTSAASIPLLIDEMNQKGMLKRGQKVVLAGFGAGLTWGATLLEW